MPFPFRLPTKDNIRERNVLGPFWDLQRPGHLVVQGPPGSGKTTAAIRRSIECKINNTSSILLVYHKLLALAIANVGYGMGDPNRVASIDRWWCHRVLGRADDKPNWLKIGRRLEPFEWYLRHLQGALARGVLPDELIVDEGQDLPLPFYQALAHLSAKNEGRIRIAVFGDENQQVVGATRADLLREIANSLHVALDRLGSNWRNTVEIWKFARQFQKRTRTDVWDKNIVDRLENQKRSGPRPRIFTYRNINERDMELLKEVRGASGNVAIVMKEKQAVESIYNFLLAADISTVNTLAYYYNSSAVQVPAPMNSGGILVTTYQSMKGLEADHVILPNFPDGGRQQQLDINAWFVACTRAQTTLSIYCHEVGGSLPHPLCDFDANTYDRRVAGVAPPAVANHFDDFDDDIPF